MQSVLNKPAKSIAADMDMSPSTLSRKLNPTDGDTRRLTCDDLEGWIESAGEAGAVIEYLVAKFLDSDTSKKARLAARAEALLSELAKVLPALKDAT